MTRALLSLAFGACSIYLTVGKAIDNGLLLQPIRRLVPGEAGGETCDFGQLDLQFIVDGSSSIKDDEFQEVKTFLSDTVAAFQSSRGPDEPDPLRVSAVQFSGNPSTEFSFSTFADSSADAIDYFRNQMKHKKGVTNTGKAITYALKTELQESRGMRPNVPKVIIIFTDGLATDKIEAPARQFHAGLPPQTRVFVVGVAKANLDQLALLGNKKPPGPEFGCNRDLAEIERDPLALDNCELDDIYRVKEFKELTSLITQIRGPKNCRAGEDQPAQLVDTGEEGIALICGPNGITVGSATRNPFEGRVYVRGHEADDACMIRGDGVEAYAGNLTFGFTDCGTKRLRQLEPPGITIEATVVFQFHRDVQTKIDVPYTIKCFYMEAQKNVKADVDVSPLTTLQQQFDLPMPTCSYKVREFYDVADDGTVNEGPEVNFAVIGDKITHVWECLTDYPQFFKMRVHNCRTQNGLQEAQLLDDRGCGLDEILVDTPQYDTSVLTAWVNTHVFKFADAPAISFDCEVSICVTNPQSVDELNGEELCLGYPPTSDSCAGITPIPGSSVDVNYESGDFAYEDDDAAFRGRRSASNSRQFFSLPEASVTFKKEHTMDVTIDQLYVAETNEIDYDALARRQALKQNEDGRLPTDSSQRKICLTHMEITLFGILSFGGFVLTAALTVAIQMRNPTEKLPSLF